MLAMTITRTLTLLRIDNDAGHDDHDDTDALKIRPTLDWTLEGVNLLRFSFGQEIAIGSREKRLNFKQRVGSE